MFYCRKYYETHKDIIEDTSKKLRSLFEEYENALYERLKQRNPKSQKLTQTEQNKMNLEMANYYESSAIYTVYQNSYDPRMGQTLAVYVDRIPHTDIDLLESLLTKYFGNFKIRKSQKECKLSHYRTFNKNAFDYLFDNGNSKTGKLNIIFNDSISFDLEKYSKYMSKAPKNIKY